MKKLSLILLAFAISFVSGAQSTTTYTSVQDGFARSRATWGLSNPSGKLTCNNLKNANLIVNNKVRSECTFGAWGSYIMINAGGEFTYTANSEINGNGASSLNTIKTSGKIIALENLTITGPLVIEDGGTLEVAGDLNLSNEGTITGGDDVTISVGGELNIQGTVRDAITLGKNSELTVTDRMDIRNARIILDGSTFTAESDVRVDGDSYTGIILTGSNFNVAGDYKSPNGTLLIGDGSEVNVSGYMELDGAGRNAVETQTGGNLTVDGHINIAGSAILLVAGGTASAGNGVDISGGGDLEITDDGLLTVNGDLDLGKVSGGGTLNVHEGNIIVQSIDNGDGTYTGGNFYIAGGTTAKVYDGGQITILGNKNFGVEVGASNVEGNLVILDYNGDLIVEPFGKILVYNDVLSRPEQFYTNWTNPGGGTPPNFVTIGGSTCNNWGGPLGTCNDGDGTLPIELMSFTAEAGEVGVVLDWETATELNNDYFTIERSYDGMEFEIIGTVSGGGTTDDTETYTYIDKKALPGTIYYRLKQTDFDGASETFDPVSVNYLPVGDNVTLFPNPIDHGLLKMSLTGFSSDRPANIRITDLAGRTVIMKTVDISNAAYTVVEMNVASKLDRGAYIVNINQGAHAFTKRLVKM